jgi:hypothetical protein
LPSGSLAALSAAAAWSEVVFIGRATACKWRLWLRLRFIAAVRCRLASIGRLAAVLRCVGCRRCQPMAMATVKAKGYV